MNRFYPVHAAIVLAALGGAMPATASADILHAPEAVRTDARGESAALTDRSARAWSGKVSKVYDGDTLLLESGERIRFLGINTPEVASPDKAGEPGGDEAKRWLAARIAGQWLRLEPDVEKTDRYHRRLAHVFSSDGVHINRLLVERGLAFVEIHPPNVRYAKELLGAQQRAERERKGLWAMPAYRVKSIEVLGAAPIPGWQRLTGRPRALTQSRRFRRLIFSERFEVRIPRENLQLFAPLESYLGRSLEVRGWLTHGRGGHSMLVRHPSAIVPAP